MGLQFSMFLFAMKSLAIQIENKAKLCNFLSFIFSSYLVSDCYQLALQKYCHEGGW